MKTLIEFKNVTKQYRIGEVSIKALDGVDFSIAEGEFVVILGASGAGKSTILNILGGMDTATSGQVIVGGEEITRLKDKRLTAYRGEQVGFVFQFYNLIPNLNALENVEFATEVCKDHLDAKKVLAQVGLQDRARNFPSQLSGGEQQRVAIARAVAKNPLLLLCDEPTGALDYITGKSVLKLLQDLNRDTKKCVILVTHNSAIAPIADKVIKVKSGTIESITVNAVKQSIEEIEW
ncbi:putative ABC transport system ATP-binding protein [Paenibacillus cellulosilyticus]|uniref:Putative ABC transport system ATP-binding protein n=1 Tax=Paenibacillus cellulosilyticus TaxID=375489 RepID=A0A2V2Z0X0_9BACL|nr:ABC transporter ATP-binding protein [Paenibacillus cellulosilyticus]PWW08724.1 putative ABC transport system ATP-binding protein [Paenibacillus cellulosilyticus]QKS48288.1 ABC transporter ATP-binding protein [Paenibacillus cellulosilyticus]